MENVLYRPTSPQSSFFDVDNYCSEALPSNDWCYVYNKRILPLIDEEKFRHFYSESEGRYNCSIKTMISLLIFMGMEKLTWRDVEFQYPRRLDWLIATNTPLGEAAIDHTTIFKFYQRLEADDTVRNLFSKITDKFIQCCSTTVKKQRTDSFYIHGWLKILSRYGLFKETIRKFLLSLRKQKPGLYKKVKGQLSTDYLEKEFDLTEKDRERAHKKISLMARDLYCLKSAFENHNQVKHHETFKILCAVFTQQCELKESSDTAPEVIIKKKPDSNAICSPHNPEVRYVRKGSQRITGNKGFVTETCDPENKTRFITDIEVINANENDSKQQHDIQKRLIENEFKPEKQYEDAGFVNGKTIMASQENEIELEGPSSGRSQSFEMYEDKNELIVIACPKNQAPKDQKRSKKTDRTIVHFDRTICDKCSCKPRCPVKIGKRMATFTVDEAQYVGTVRHHKYMRNKKYRKECAVRAGVEATVSELTRVHGMRKSRHRKNKRTKMQLIFAAISCNVKRFIRYGDKYGYIEPILAL